MAVVLLQPPIFLLQPPKQAPGVPPARASRVRLCCHRWPCHPSILTHTSCYSPATAASQRSRSSQPTYSPPRGHPLPRLPQLRVVPFLGLAIVHRPGALGAVWSTWSTTNFHRKSNVRGEADSWVQAAARKCLLITRKIIIPPPDSRDPPDGQLYFAKKMFPPDCWDLPATSSHARKCVRAKKRFDPLTAGTHQLHLRTQGSASGQKKTIRPPDCWDPPATSSHARKCVWTKKQFAPLTARTHQLHLRTQGSA